MEQHEPDPLKELYQNFKHALRTQKPSELFYDEDELVALYDYADGVSDDYVRHEVLYCGARLYPDSTALAERRLDLYRDVSEDNDNATDLVSESLCDHDWSESAAAQIIRIAKEHPQNPADALAYTVGQFDRLSGNDFSELCIAVEDLGQYDWFKNNLESLIEKADNEFGLLYRVIRLAIINDDYDTLIKVAEKLIETDPFSSIYWVYLLVGQAHKGLNDDAHSTYDYAKALAASESTKAVLNLADAVIRDVQFLCRDMQEQLELLAASHPDDFEIIDMLCAYYAREDDRPKVNKKLTDFLSLHPDNFTALRQLLYIDSADSGHFVDLHLSSPNADVRRLTDAGFIAELWSRGNENSLYALLGRTYPAFKSDHTTMSIWMQTLFFHKDYNRIIEVFEDGNIWELFDDQPHKKALMALLYDMSLIKTGHISLARQSIAKNRQYVEKAIVIVPIAVRMTLHTYLTFANQVERHHDDDTLYWDRLDILHTGKF